MDMKLSITAIVLSFATLGIAQPNIFDIKSFGGASNADITMAFTNAWKAACGSTTASKVIIPRGIYKIHAVDVKGPCKAPIEVQVDGTIQASQNPDELNDASYQWVKFGYVDYFTLSGKGVFDGNGETAWTQNDCGKNSTCKRRSMNFGFNFLKLSIVQDIISKDSKNFHVNVLGCTNFTFDGLTITAPATSKNTDGIHIGRSTDDVKVLNTNISTGDDCISLGQGSRQITVQNVNCGPGHGISVGSLGKNPKEEATEHVLVKNCTISNTDNGVRIKTWPSSPGTSPITDMHFEDTIMVNVLNPVIIDQEYCPWNQCSKQVPSKIKISKVIFKNIRGTTTAAAV
ncbi:polygalacturonase [Medicago truncatula]|uniref:Polygalacturonase n=1 Tax=Medicago truncatula TaxID=3880 RepID=Q704S5_MEDTR|nr:polygalacturonase [Medicago truncatula]AET00957.1 polygalacturonase [Medicago truncatula]CAF07050.1 polygalacturonase precursor [Medicago truncatula]